MLKKAFSVIILFSVIIIPISCGGMIGETMDASGSPAALTYSVTSAVYTKNAVIANNLPTVSGEVTSWSINHELPSGLTFDKNTGIISGSPYIEQTPAEYRIKASNKYGSTTTTISITVNLEAPKALTYSTTSVVYTIGAVISNNVPAVTGTVTSWSITPALPAGLILNTSNGIISGTPTAEQTAKTYTITAGNAYGSASAVISITINHSPPAALSYSVISAVYTRNAVISNNIPTVTGTVTAWSVTPALPAGLSLNTSTGIISGTPTTVQSAVSYTITASNSIGSTTALISITVNYAAPTALSYSTTSAVYTKDAVITNNVPTVTGTVTSWSITPALPLGLTLNTATGVITGTPTVNQSVTNYIITAANSGGSVTANISITVNYAAPTALSYTTTSAVYTKDAVITNNAPTVTGTVTSWSITPALPSGLTLNTVTGVITGTPTVNQSVTNYIITAANSGGSVTANVTITVNYAAPTALSYTTASAVYTKDAVITNNIPTVTGTVTSWSITPALPSGLTLSTSSGIISGTPAVIQSATNYIVTAANSGGSKSVNLTITVNYSAPTALSYSLASAVYTKDAVITNNVPTVTGTVTSWSVTPSLPSGLTLSTSNGIITGTPVNLQSVADYTITAANSGGSISTVISISVNYAAPSSLSYSASSAVYTKDAVITNNNPTVTGTVTSWSVTPSLPSGLTLSTSTGIITGTPVTIQSAANYTITASNSGGSTSAVITISVKDPSATAAGSIADYSIAKDSVLRAIPDTYINSARTTLSIAYYHTSHGTHVSYGIFGLPGFKTGDDVKFGITNNSTTRDSSKLDFHDYPFNGSPYQDLSTADNGSWSTWLNQVRTYLDNSSNSNINVMMWSWCDITGHSVSSYLASMETLISEYGPGGSKIGTGTGKTKTIPVTFIFMTGHAVQNANTGTGKPKNQAQLITDYCSSKGYYCIDYYSIDTHDMNDAAYDDASDDAVSAIYGGGNFYLTWQNANTKGVQWYENRNSPAGSVIYGEHTSQHITANRKAFAFWWVLARISGWDGN